MPNENEGRKKGKIVKIIKIEKGLLITKEERKEEKQ